MFSMMCVTTRDTATDIGGPCLWRQVNRKKMIRLSLRLKNSGDQTIVRKSNDLVQMTRNNLTLSQQRLMLHIFSMIKPEDTDLPSYELSIYDFIKMTGMDPHSGALYKQVRKNIEELANAPIQ